MPYDKPYPECRKNTHGYTLVEMAISIIIVGLIVASLAQAYTLYQRQEKIRVTSDNIKSAVSEIQKFKQQNGFFPCPAPLTAPRTDGSYGEAAPDCTTATLAVGSPAPGSLGIDGLAVANSVRTVTPATGPAYNPVILIGAIPFRNLNMDEKDTYDGYGSKILYIVTQKMTSLATYSDKEGGVTIVAQDGVTQMTNPANSGLFAILSPGQNRIGAYDKNGNQSPCGAGLDTENCDNDSIFMAAQQSDSAAVNFDDKIDFFSELSDTLWVRASANPNNIVNVSQSDVGVGTSTPVTTLDIKNASGPPGMPEGTVRASGRIMTQKLCPDGSYATDNNCFEPRNIGGDNSSNPGDVSGPGNGMKCPPGTYMNGIQDGRPLCDSASISCSSPIEIMKGVKPDGSADCKYRPCDAATRTICGSNKTLPASDVNTVISLTEGASRVETYKCQVVGNTVTWVSTPPNTGLCNCTPSSNTITRNCNYWGAGWYGTYDETTSTVCPSGSTTHSNTFWTTCTCGPQADWVYPDTCGNGFNSGSKMMKRTWQCPSGTWSWPAVEVSSTCACVAPNPSTKTITTGTCADGYTGTITQDQTFDTSVCGWVNQGAVNNTCTCNASETRDVYENPTCASHEHAAVQTHYSQVRDGANCTWGTKTVVTPGVCQENLYFWQSIQTTNTTSDNQVGPRVMDSCSYSQFGVTTSCSQSSGSKFAIHQCQCKPGG
jgi:type II secretory pathway pseudopilin PulG